MSGIDRRTFLEGVGGAAALAGTGLLGLPGCGASSSLETGLLACLADAEAASSVGREAWARLGEPERRELARSIAAEDLVVWERLAIEDTRKLFAALRAKHLRDFEQARTLEVRGWVLSETEARLCALFAASA